MRITLLIAVLAYASTAVLAGSAVLRGRSAGAGETSADDSSHAHADRVLEGTAATTAATGAADSSSIPSYEEILNIFKRVGGGGGGNNNNNMNQRNGRKNRKGNKKKNSSSSSDDDTNVYDNSSDIPKNEKLGFLWHLWYTKGIKYEARGSDFCVMCKGKSGCDKGDEVVTSHCNPNDPDMRWEYIKVKNGVGLMKTRYHNLCLEMNDSKYRLKKCDKDEERQMFQGLSYKGKFKLHPYKRRFSDKKQCLSMLHHPVSSYPNTSCALLLHVILSATHISSLCA